MSANGKKTIVTSADKLSFSLTNSPFLIQHHEWRGGRSSGCGGCGNNDRSGRSHGRGQNDTGTSKASKNGLCTTLGNNVFDYGHKAAADQMQTLWEKLIQYFWMSYGQDISNELQNKVTVILAEPVHSPTDTPQENWWFAMGKQTFRWLA
jgi:hypothetical protein